jgi:drug/metabolite transporter (DMT)-like permease
MQWKSANRLALAALLGGATGIGFAPILVRLSEVGPSATAFYRILFALPLLAVASALESSRPRTPALATRGREETMSTQWLCVIAGTLFAGDLAFWHWSIKLTSVADSTLLTNCAPFFVMIGARVIFKEKITVWLLVGMSVASVGAALLVGASFQMTSTHLLGDALALVTAAFYGGYLLTIKYLRLRLPTATTLTWSGLVSCAWLLLIAKASHEPIRITSAHGWMVLVSLALVSHLGGQGLIAHALAHLPAGFSSVALLLQPVVAAFLAWIILSEPLHTAQWIGGIIILAGIGITCVAPIRSNAARLERACEHAP